MSKIVIDGRQGDARPIKERHLVEIDGHSVWLSYTAFVFFVALANARIAIRPDGWISYSDIGVPGTRTQYIYRLRQELACCDADTYGLVDTKRPGLCRLVADPLDIEIRWRKLSEMDNAILTKIAEACMARDPQKELL